MLDDLFVEKSASFQLIEIDNTKEASVNGKWKDPGAALYVQLLNAMYMAPDNESDINDPRNKYTPDYLKETYLIAPINKIKYGPYDMTPFSRSGCKYPHHVIRNGKLVVHIQGLKAAYARAKQMGIFSGEVKEHLERHYKELGLYEGSKMQLDESMDQNFQDIENYIREETGIDLYCSKNLLKASDRSNKNFEIRMINEKDYTNPKFLEWLYELNEFHEDEQEDLFKLFQSDPTHEVYVFGYFIDGIIRGFIRIQYKEKYNAYAIGMLFVDPSYHRCGIGSSLLKKMITHFGNRDILLNVFTDNFPAIELYQKFGFTIERILNCSDDPECPSEWIDRKQYCMLRKGSETHNENSSESNQLYHNLQSIANSIKFHDGIYTKESSEDEESVVPKKEDKNGVKRKNLYIAFIEYCKKLNPKNTFSSLFDKDIFKERYSFIPHEMRYFYRLANPMSCIIPVIQFESVSFCEDTGIQQALDQIKKNNKSESEDSEDVGNDLTEENDVDETIEDDSVENEMMIFFSINDLPKINEKNDTNEYVIFAGSPKEYYVFRNKDKKIYKSNDDKITEPIADSFDLFIQKIVGKEYL